MLVDKPHLTIREENNAWSSIQWAVDRGLLAVDQIISPNQTGSLAMLRQPLARVWGPVEALG
jgi:hypothetical protein